MDKYKVGNETIKVGKYELEKIIVKERYYEIYINADSNDGDYISRTTTMNQEEFDEIVDELINIKENYSAPHKFEDYPNEYDLNIPYSDWGSCHSLEELTVKMYDTDGSVYNIKF